MPYRHVRPSIAVACLTVLIATGSASATAGADPIAASPGTGLTPTSDVVIPLRQLTGLDLPSLRLSGLMRHPIGTVATMGDRPLIDAPAVRMQPGAAPSTGNPAETRLPADAPNIITRARWGAGDVSRCTPATTRHARSTASDTGPAMSDGIVHALYDYRTKTLRRCDIGYNTLIDKHSQAFAGRSGGPNPANFGIGLLDSDTANRIGPGLVLALARMLAGTSPAPASAAAPLSTSTSMVTRKSIAAGDNQLFGLGDGNMVSAAEQMLQKFLDLGTAAGKLVLPPANAYLAPGGPQQGLQNGSLLLNQAGGIVTSLLKTFTDTYNQSYNAK